MLIPILVAVIAAAATIAAAYLSSRATVQAAELEAGKPHDRVRTLSYRVYRVPIWMFGLALIVGLSLGILSQHLINYFIKIRPALEILGHLEEIKHISINNIDTTLDRLNTSPWQEAGTPPPKLSLDKTLTPGRGKDGALRVAVDLDPSVSDWAGAQLKRDELPEAAVDLIVVWAYVPETDESLRAKLKARIECETYDQPEGYWRLYGREIALSPGKWTPVIWTASSAVTLVPPSQAQGRPSNAVDFSRYDPRLSSLFLMIWATAAPYNGSVYLDDARFFQSR